MINLYLVRHGESEGNLDHSIYEKVPNEEVNLTKKGIREIKKTAKQIKKNLNRSSIYLITSPFRRTMNSSKIIAKELNIKENLIIQEPLLSEVSYGFATGADNLYSYINASPIERRLARQNYIHYYPERGESQLDLFVRVGLFVCKYDKFSLCSDWIIVSHAGVCASLHAYLVNDPPKENTPWWKNGQARKYVINHHMFAKELTLD